MKKNRLCIAIALLLLGSASLAQVEKKDSTDIYDLGIEDLMNLKITTASKVEENVGDAPAIISVITSKEIEAYGALTLRDVIDRATNIYLTSGYTYRNNMVSIRGNASSNANTNVLILVNGRPYRESLDNGINNSIYAGFPLDQVERLEIIRGPGSVLYGTTALTGVINIITKFDKTQSIQGKFNYGTFNTRQASISGSQKWGGIEFNGGAMWLKSDGWDYTTKGTPKAVPNGNGASLAANGVKLDETTYGVNAQLSYKGLKLSTVYTSTRQANLGIFANWLDAVGVQKFLFNTETNRTLIDLGYEKKISAIWRSTLNVTYNGFREDKAYPETVYFKFDGKSNDVLAEFTNYITPKEGFNIIAGVLTNTQTGNARSFEKRTDSSSPLGYTQLNPLATEPNLNPNPHKMVTDYDQTWWSAYLQVDYKLTKEVKLIAGAQSNKVSGLDLSTSPRFGMIYNFAPAWGVKALYGKAFRSPAQSERNANNIPAIISNSNLKPEIIGTFETQLFFHKKSVELYLTYYNSLQEDVIRTSQTPDEFVIFSLSIPGAPLTQVATATYLNGGKLRSQGLEFEGKAFINSNWSASFGASYQEIKNDEGNTNAYGMPKAMVKTGLSYTTGFGLQLSAFNSFFGYGQDNINAAFTDVFNPPASSYHFLSMQATYKVVKNISLSVYATNVLDEKVYYPEYSKRQINTLPGRAGRALNGSVIVKF